MKKKLGIIGGIGSKASAYFYMMIIEKTAVDKDQDHIDMVIINDASMPDRTEYILDNTKPSPYPSLLKNIKILESSGVDLIAIPCNTSCYFYEDLQKETTVPVLNLIEDTVNFIKEKGINKVYILATSGTIQSRLYQMACERIRLDYRIPNEEKQDLVMDVIYNNVKKGQPIDQNNWSIIIEDLKDDECVILGCTELSILKKELMLTEQFIDPLEVESEIIITNFGKKIKK